ncbi:MAG TPA: hypothetical protein PLL16_09030, partial [Methanoculleus sp.]|nr:hypothetical protein [Methanoculleus sp.]
GGTCHPVAAEFRAGWTVLKNRIPYFFPGGDGRIRSRVPVIFKNIIIIIYYDNYSKPRAAVSDAPAGDPGSSGSIAREWPLALSGSYVW